MNIKFRKNIKIINSDDVFDVMQKILCRENKIDLDKEHFWIIGLNLHHKILFIELVSIGGLKSTNVEPMNVFRVAVLKGAFRVILVHNHPGGSLKQSLDDEDITDRLIQVGKILAIEVFDHLIISTKSYISLSDSGVLLRLQESTKWMPPYEIAKKIKAEAAKIRKESVITAEKKGLNKGRKEGLKVGEKKGLKAGEQKGLVKGKLLGKFEGEAVGLIKGAKKEKLEIAKKMPQKGISVKEISAITGLAQKMIKRL